MVMVSVIFWVEILLSLGGNECGENGGDVAMAGR
jgi:hypothetical protein